ncbi:MAG TPA: hypothetical protein VN753_18365 [Terracidiphilus sp.]|nr:hypothetical protein [Terracidiphilus sp.]
MDRRNFIHLYTCASLSSALARAARGSLTGRTDRDPSFSTRNTRWQAAYDKALSILAGNVRVLPPVGESVLIEGAQYRGIWLECAPHESLAYRRLNPRLARNTHIAFFKLQKPDGQLPAWIREASEGFAQIQMVVPIAATAWEIAQATGDSELLEMAYQSCSQWDRWLMRYRNTRSTGLVEGFCTFDTGTTTHRVGKEFRTNARMEMRGGFRTMRVFRGCVRTFRPPCLEDESRSQR